MVFLLGSTGPEGYTVNDAVVGLRALRMSDFAEWAEIRRVSRNELIPFEPQWTDNELSRTSFKLRVKVHQREIAGDTGYAFGIFRLTDGQLIGGVSLSNVRRGVTQSAELGYWLGTPFTKNGHMSAAVRLIIGYAFGTLSLHRLEAATLLDNYTSIRVLERNGFRREGEARSYLKINGVWRDHVLFGLVEDEARIVVMSAANIAVAAG